MNPEHSAYLQTLAQQIVEASKLHQENHTLSVALGFLKAAYYAGEISGLRSCEKIYKAAVKEVYDKLPE